MPTPIGNGWHHGICRLGSGRGSNAGPLALRCPQLLVSESGEQAIVAALDRALELLEQLPAERQVKVLNRQG
jgi:hypothetical protein